MQVKALYVVWLLNYVPLFGHKSGRVWVIFVLLLWRVLLHCFPLSNRRLDPSERPLQMVYDYLAAMGYKDPLRVQREAANSDLSCMIRFYSGE